LASFIALAGCVSSNVEQLWHRADKLVLGEGTEKVRVVEGEALKEYMQNMVLDQRSTFRPATDTRTGYILVDGKRLLITHSVESEGARRDQMTIYQGAQNIHLIQHTD
jgi:N-dimethylarginine dimethylaminohydrolase